MTATVSAPVLLEGWVETVPGVLLEGLSLDAERSEKYDACVVRNQREAALAASRGAALLIHDVEEPVACNGTPAAAVPGLESRLPELAARFYHYPAQELKLAGIVGRSGRTSAAHYIAQSWQRVEGPAALVGRHGNGLFRAQAPLDLEYLDPFALQRVLAHAVEAEAGMAALELTPAFLERGWADELAFDVAVFTSAENTNGSEPGDVAADVEESAARRLFTDCRPQFAVLNHDEAEGKTLSRLAGHGTQVLTFGTHGSTELQGAILGMDSAGMTVRLASPWGGGEVRTGLLGRRNLSNLLAAAGALALLGMNWNKVMHQVEIMSAAPGRMHCLAGEPGQPAAVLDSAETPAALENVLLALRSHLHGRLYCVLVDDGETAMLDVAAACADGVFAASRGNRREAIRAALAQSGTGDILLVAGDWGGRDYRGGEATVLDLLEEAA